MQVLEGTAQVPPPSCKYEFKNWINPKTHRNVLSFIFFPSTTDKKREKTIYFSTFCNFEKWQCRSVHNYMNFEVCSVHNFTLIDTIFLSQ